MVSEANTGESQLAAISAGNNVALAMHGEMQQMRQMQVVQNAAQTTFMAKQEADADSKKAAADKMNVKIKGTACQEANTCKSMDQQWEEYQQMHKGE